MAFQPTDQDGYGPDAPLDTVLVQDMAENVRDATRERLRHCTITYDQDALPILCSYRKMERAPILWPLTPGVSRIQVVMLGTCVDADITVGVYATQSGGGLPNSDESTESPGAVEAAMTIDTSNMEGTIQIYVTHQSELDGSPTVFSKVGTTNAGDTYTGWGGVGTGNGSWLDLAASEVLAPGIPTGVVRVLRYIPAFGIGTRARHPENPEDRQVIRYSDDGAGDHRLWVFPPLDEDSGTHRSNALLQDVIELEGLGYLELHGIMIREQIIEPEPAVVGEYNYGRGTSAPNFRHIYRLGRSLMTHHTRVHQIGATPDLTHTPDTTTGFGGPIDKWGTIHKLTGNQTTKYELARAILGDGSLVQDPNGTSRDYVAYRVEAVVVQFGADVGRGQSFSHDFRLEIDTFGTTITGDAERHTTKGVSWRTREPTEDLVGYLLALSEDGREPLAEHALRGAFPPGHSIPWMQLEMELLDDADTEGRGLVLNVQTRNDTQPDDIAYSTNPGRYLYVGSMTVVSLPGGSLSPPFTGGKS